MPHTIRIVLSTFWIFSLTFCSWLIDITGVTGTQSGIAGVFEDGIQTPIAGHRIDLYSDSGATIIDSQYTDHEGKFLFHPLPSGKYSLEAEYLGKHGKFPEIVVDTTDSITNVTITSYGWYKYIRNGYKGIIVDTSTGQLSENSENFCTNGQDDDFDSFIDCNDTDCLSFCSNDTALTSIDTTLSEDSRIECLDGIDNDDNQTSDCEDPSCFSICEDAESTYAKCTDGEDNDSNGFTDCQDGFCSAFCSYRGYVLKYDGVDDYCLIPAVGGLDFIAGNVETIGEEADEYTLEFWFYSLNNQSAEESVVLIQTTDYDDSTPPMLLIQLYPSTSTLSIRFQSHNLQLPYTENFWNHVALIYDKGNLELILNGISQGVEEALTASTITTETLRTTFIGGSPDKTQYFSGMIFDIRTWNKALPLSQILEQQHLELKGDEPGLTGYWLGVNKNGPDNVNGAAADFSGNNKLIILGSNLNTIDKNNPTWVMKE